jgi:hypothetical protein
VWSGLRDATSTPATTRLDSVEDIRKIGGDFVDKVGTETVQGTHTALDRFFTGVGRVLGPVGTAGRVLTHIILGAVAFATDAARGFINGFTRTVEQFRNTVDVFTKDLRDSVTRLYNQMVKPTVNRAQQWYADAKNAFGKFYQLLEQANPQNPQSARSQIENNYSGLQQVANHYYYQVWGTSTQKPSEQRPWSEPFATKEAAQQKLLEIQNDYYGPNGLLRDASDKATGLHIRQFLDQSGS